MKTGIVDILRINTTVLAQMVIVILLSQFVLVTVLFMLYDKDIWLFYHTDFKGYVTFFLIAIGVKIAMEVFLRRKVSRRIYLIGYIYTFATSMFLYYLYVPKYDPVIIFTTLLTSSLGFWSGAFIAIQFRHQ